MICLLGFYFPAYYTHEPRWWCVIGTLTYVTFSFRIITFVSREVDEFDEALWVQKGGVIFCVEWLMAGALNIVFQFFKHFAS